MNKLFDFTGKKILVTGASSGIGREIAIYLSSLGVQCVITGRNQEELENTKKQLQNDKSIAITAELTDEAQLENLFKESVKDGKKLDGLVYSSGVVPTIPLRVLTKEKLTDIFDINIISFILAVRLYAKHSFSNAGSIIGISSIASVQAEKCQALYAATKGAMNSAVQALAIELAEKNININCVLPGVTAIKNKHSDEVDLLSQKQLFGAVDSTDIAALCAFLLSGAARHTTGRQFYCDNGRFL